MSLAMARRLLIGMLAGVCAISVLPMSASAVVGRTLILDGPGSGDRIAVTIVAKRDPARSSNEFVRPDDGNRFVSFKVRIVNVGRKSYSDLVSFDAVDQKHQQWGEAFWLVTEPTLGSVRIRPGDRRVGWVNFEIPKRARITRLIFEPWFGFGETGEWRLG